MSHFIQLLVFSGEQASTPDALDPSMQQYTGQFYQPTVSPDTGGGAGTDSLEEEPPLLEGKIKTICLKNRHFLWVIITSHMD